METSRSRPTVWVNGRLQEPDRHDAALTALCQAVERAVRTHHAAGTADELDRIHHVSATLLHN